MPHAATRTAASPSLSPKESPAEELARNSAALTQDELVAECDRLRDELRRRTVALASAVHELKTPLAVMAGYLELLQSEKTGSLNERQRQILEDMRGNADRLKRFIGDFLTFSALDAKSLKMNFEVTDLNACLQEVCSLWLLRFQEKGVAFYFLPGDDLEQISIDSLKLQHVVSNLLHNALKFTPPRGTVWLTAEKYHWDRRARQEHTGFQERRQGAESSDANTVRVSVADTGPGIAPEFHQDIFNEFQKLSLPNAIDSMGLGLAIARRIVHAHEGKIWVESEPGAGSKFSFLLPYQRHIEALQA